MPNTTVGSVYEYTDKMDDYIPHTILLVIYLFLLLILFLFYLLLVPYSGLRT